MKDRSDRANQPDRSDLISLPMPRFYLPASAWESSALTGDEAKHCAQVLRARAGDTITVFDGAGRSATAEITAVSKHAVNLTLGETRQSAPLRPSITLAQAIPKGKNMDWIVQKAVELGVATIQPLVTRYTVVQPGEGKADKWQRVALEACKQCGQNVLPQVNEPLDFKSWLQRQDVAREPVIFASLAPGARPYRDVLRDLTNPARVTVLVGPEGDFSTEETQAALTAGCQPVTLGDIVLRAETASLFCLAALRYEFA